MSTSQAMQAQALYQDSLLQKQNVVGVAVGFKESKGDVSGEVAVVVLVEEKKPLAALSAQDVVPKELEGMKTDVYEVGFLRAQQSQNPRQPFRPIIPNGVSVGHFKVTAGTLGTIVKDRVTGERLLLSNNHVLANSNDAQIGDIILQPAAMDGGTQDDDVVAKLHRFIPLRYIGDPIEQPPPNTPPTQPPPQPPSNPTPQPPSNPTPRGGCDIVSVVASAANFLASVLGSDKQVVVSSKSAAASAMAVSPTTGLIVPVSVMAAAGEIVPENTVDCAVALPVDPNMFSDDILGIGIVNETAVAMLGMRVRKYGRTTQYTEGNITLLNATVNISYSTLAGPKQARFTGQVITEAMSQGGDSGSLMVEVNENKAVGLLFAGSNLATIFTPIDQVLNALNVTL
jgi:hypothetical protein